MGKSTLIAIFKFSNNPTGLCCNVLRDLKLFQTSKMEKQAFLINNAQSIFLSLIFIEITILKLSDRMKR